MSAKWESRLLGDLLEIQNGYAFDSKMFNAEIGPPLIRIRSLRAGVERNTRFDGEYENKYLVKAGDLLIGMDGDFGCYEWKGEPSLLNQRVCRLQEFSDLLEPKFLLYGLNSYLKTIEEATGYTTVKHLSSKQILSIQFPVPSRVEQQRIVAILDKAFAGIATAKANAERNLRNAREVFDGYRRAVFTPRPNGWVHRHLREVCEKITDGTHQTPKYFDEGVVFLSSKNVTSGSIDWENVKYIDEKQHIEMHRRIAPRRGDILLAKNGTTGVAAIVDRDTVFDLYVSLAHLRALPAIRPRLLLHFVNSPVAKEQFNKRLKGVGVPNLHLEEIREVMVSFPFDLTDQDEVIDELDALACETKRLESIYTRKLTALDELKQSLLHQAFSGKLT